MPKRLPDLVSDFKRSLVVATLKRNGGNQREAAAALGITKRGLEKLLVQYKIGRRRYARKLPIPPMRKKTT